MAGWTDSGASRGRGVSFTNRGGANTNSGVRWRERRPPPHQQQQQQQQQQQHQQEPQHRYPPFNDNAHHRHHHSSQPRSSGLAAGCEQAQGGSSTSTRRPQPPRPTFTGPKAPASAATPMPSANANEPEDKSRRNAANFECNVCFDMADDPVVTKCGHLFCWECLYQWLHVHSDHRECPVCKGQVANDAIIPIYGRGGSAASVHAAPPRPTGVRVESSRQQQLQTPADWHMDEDDDDPFDLQEFRLSSIRDAMMSFMPDEQLVGYDDYTNSYDEDFDAVSDYDLLGFPVFAPAGAGAGSSRGHAYHSVVSDDMERFLYNTSGINQTVDFSYHGGRRHRGRARGAAAASADHSSIVGMVMSGSVVLGSSGASHNDTGAGPRNITGGSSRPNGGLGWTERRGRSNRNSNSGGGRGTQNSRRQGANYN